MSIGPIGGANAIPSPAARNVGKPESGELPGAAEHDGDADDAGVRAPTAKASSAPAPGHVNLKA